MDASFSEALKALATKLRGKTTVSKEIVVEHIAALEETIQSLNTIKAGFEDTKEALDMADVPKRIAQIERELHSMEAFGRTGISTLGYTQLPQGYMDSEEYMKRRNQLEAIFNENMKEQEDTLAKLAAVPALSAIDTRGHAYAKSLEYKLEQARMRMSQVKTTRLEFVRNHKPFDSKPFLARKEALADELHGLYDRTNLATIARFPQGQPAAPK